MGLECVLIGTFLALSAATDVTLTAEKAIHRARSAGKVRFTLTNHSSVVQTVKGPAPWQAFEGMQEIYAPPSSGLVEISLAPGESKLWVWNKKRMDGSWAARGTYTLRVGPIFPPGSLEGFYRSVDIALTPTGTLAGTSPFPLALGNEWEYQGTDGSVDTMNVTAKSGTWYQVKKLIGANRWVRMTGLWYPALQTSSDLRLFRFNRLPGYTYSVNLGTITELTVGSIDDTIMTPAGTFKNCYRLDSSTADAWYLSFWFAPGVGLVQYAKNSLNGPVTYRLRDAKMRGVDGRLYQIGQGN